MDQRFQEFAEALVRRSIKVKKGELIYVDSMSNTPIEMVLAVMDEVRRAGGFAYPVRRDERLLRRMNIGSGLRQLRFVAAHDIMMIKKCDGGIIFRDFGNIFHSTDVPSANTQRWAKYYTGPVIKVRSPRRWILSRWPTPAMAQLMNMSTEQLEDLFFRAVLFDYRRMARAAMPLKALMERTDHVRIIGPGDTDLGFSIKGIPAKLCVGELNIPDGEVFTAPVRDSVNGVIHYNTKSVSREGSLFEGVRFEVAHGQIVKATCDSGDQKKLDAILNTDEGARYFGEFAFGFHPFIDTAVGETLFDEKVRGSFHLTPGKCYKVAPNGNSSNIHWDLVCIQRPEYGGGTILFDGKVIRKDGLFVPKALQGLNPDRLLAK